MTKTIEDFRKIHKNKPGFVMGNGPSLTARNLSVIHNTNNFISIGANAIHLIYPQTNWRADYICCQDRLDMLKLIDEFGKHSKYCFLMRRSEFDIVTKNKIFSKNVILLEDRGGPFKGELISFDLRKGVYDGSSVSYFCLQLAAYLGLNPIYLLGFDHSYNQQENESKPHIQNDEQNHFCRNYRIKGEVCNKFKPKLVTKSFRRAYFWFKTHNIEIYNVTHNSKLNIFPKKRLENIL